MNNYAYLTLRQYIYKEDSYSNHNYQQALNLLQCYDKIARFIYLNFDKSKSNENLYNELESNHQLEYINFNQSQIYKIIDQMRNIIQEYSDDSYQDLMHKDRLCFYISNRDILKKFLDQNLIVLNQQFNNIRFQFFDQYSNIEIQRIKIYIKDENDKIPFDITYRKKVKNINNISQRNNAYLYLTNTDLSILINDQQYCIDIKDFTRKLNEAYDCIDHDDDEIQFKARFMYNRLLNEAYNFVYYIIKNILHKNHVKELIIKKEDEESTYFKSLIVQLLEYFAKIYYIDIKQYRINSDILEYISIFSQNQLRSQNVKRHMSGYKNGHKIIYDDDKNRLFICSLNAVYNLKRHHGNEIEINDNDFDYNLFDSHNIVSIPKLSIK